MRHIDKLSEELADDVINHLIKWMGLTASEDIKFHFYRMRLLESMNSEPLMAKKLLLLCDRITTKCKFDTAQAVSDKVMGEQVARYIFARILLKMNEHYLKILELEADKIKAENNSVGMKVIQLKTKIEQH